MFNHCQRITWLDSQTDQCTGERPVLTIALSCYDIAVIASEEAIQSQVRDTGLLRLLRSSQ
jgi:hypothetical protein